MHLKSLENNNSFPNTLRKRLASQQSDYGLRPDAMPANGHHGRWHAIQQAVITKVCDFSVVASLPHAAHSAISSAIL
jgi:hypothetical protein